MTLQQKLKQLWQETLDSNQIAAHIVIHMLYSAIEQGTEKAFAKHCTSFSQPVAFEASIDGSRELLPGEKPEDIYPSGPDFIC